MSQGKRRTVTWGQMAGTIVAVKLSGLTTYGYIVKGSTTVKLSWLAVFPAALIALGMGLLVHVLSNRFPGDEVFAYSRKIMGARGGWAVNLTLVSLFLFWGVVSISQFSEVFSNVIYLLTPKIVFVIVITLLAMQAASGAPHIIAKLGFVSGIAIVLATVAVAALSFNRWETANLMPPFEGGPLGFVKQALTPIGVFGEITWVGLLVIPHLDDPKDGARAMMWALATSSVMVAIGAITLVAVLGPEFLAINIFPAFTVATYIAIGHILERLEWALVFLWLATMTVKISLLLYGASQGIKSLLPVKSPALSLWPAAAITLVGAQFAFANVQAIETFVRPEHWSSFALPLQLVVPGVLLLVAAIRGARDDTVS